MFGFPHRALPTVNSPFGPPSMLSVNDVTARAGRPSNVVTSRVPEIDVVAPSCWLMKPVSFTTRLGRPLGLLTRYIGPVSGAGRSGESAFALPTLEPAGHELTSSCSREHSVPSAAGLASSPSGSVTTDFLIAALWSGTVTVVENDGWWPTSAGASAEPALAESFGANGRLSHPVAWNGAVTLTTVPSSAVNEPEPLLASQVSGLRRNPSLSILRLSSRMRIGMPAMIVGSLSTPRLSTPMWPSLWRSLSASSLTTVPRSNGPTAARTTVVMRASSGRSSAALVTGSERYTFPVWCSGSPPFPTTVSTVPIWLSAGQLPLSATWARVHIGTELSAPTTSSGRDTSVPTMFFWRSGLVIDVVNFVS